MRKGVNIWFVLLALLVGAAIMYLFQSIKNETFKTNEGKIIAYEIARLNKLITSQREYSKVYTFKDSRSLPYLQNYFSFDKKVIIMVNAKVQVLYDLSQLEIESDSVNKRIILKNVPEAEKQLIPEIQFFDLKQSTFNTFKDDELNDIQEEALNKLKKEIEKDKSLESIAQQQLIDNLEALIMTAEIYGWTFENQTTLSINKDLD